VVTPVATIMVPIANADMQPIHANADVHIIRLRRGNDEGQTGSSDQSNCKCSHFETPVIASKHNRGGTHEVPGLRW
jgi:hypothetical protein